MPSTSGSDNSNDNFPDLKLKEHENVGGIPGKEAHKGDVAPPNADDAGRRISPESGPPDKH